MTRVLYTLAAQRRDRFRRPTVAGGVGAGVVPPSSAPCVSEGRFPRHVTLPAHSAAREVRSPLPSTRSALASPACGGPGAPRVPRASPRASAFGCAPCPALRLRRDGEGTRLRQVGPPHPPSERARSGVWWLGRGGREKKEYPAASVYPPQRWNTPVVKRAGHTTSLAPPDAPSAHCYPTDPYW